MVGSHKLFAQNFNLRGSDFRIIAYINLNMPLNISTLNPSARAVLNLSEGRPWKLLTPVLQVWDNFCEFLVDAEPGQFLSRSEFLLCELGAVPAQPIIMILLIMIITIITSLYTYSISTNYYYYFWIISYCYYYLATNLIGGVPVPLQSHRRHPRLQEHEGGPHGGVLLGK